MRRARNVLRGPVTEPAGSGPSAVAVLAHDERRLRRKLIRLADGGTVLVDLPEPITLLAGDALRLDDGALVAVQAAPEDLYAVTARDPVHLAELAWHIGNRHLAAEISAERILILRDHVIRAMLEGLGAQVADVTGPFTPVRGAYAGHVQGSHHDAPHGHGHHDRDHDHHDQHGHGHDGRHHHHDGAGHHR